MRRIEVAVGVLRQDDKVLVAQRLVKDLYYQKWEFPGGKLEINESPEQALTRELHEELNIDVANMNPLIRLDHNYVDRHVRLHVFEVTDFSGELQGKEGQAIQWLLPRQCMSLDFLEANQPIVNAVLLPKLVLITDIKKYGITNTLKKIQYFQSFGAVMVQVRESNESEATIQGYINKIRSILDDSSLLVLNGEPELAEKMACDGVQLNRHRAKNYHHRDELPSFWVGASCHSDVELMQAEKIADFAFLSPVKHTQSHPQQVSLGWSEFSENINQVKLPVYALGGMSYTDIDNAIHYGAQGVAKLSAAWE